MKHGIGVWTQPKKYTAIRWMPDRSNTNAVVSFVNNEPYEPGYEHLTEFAIDDDTDMLPGMWCVRDEGGVHAVVEHETFLQMYGAHPYDALEFLRRTSAGDGRIVSTADLDQHQIAEARVTGRVFVTPTGLGYVVLPWDLRTAKDAERERRHPLKT